MLIASVAMLLGAYDPIPLSIGIVGGVMGFLLGVRFRQIVPTATAAPGVLGIIGFVLAAAFAYVVLWAVLIMLLLSGVALALWNSRGLLQELFAQSTSRLRMIAVQRFAQRKLHQQLERARTEYEHRQQEILHLDITVDKQRRFLQDAEAQYLTEIRSLNNKQNR